MTGEDLGYRPSVLEQTKFDYSPSGKVFNKGLDDKDDQKEGLLKRLKNIEKNQNVNNNDKNKKNNDESESSSARSKSSIYLTPPSSARSKSSKKTLISDDKLERSAYLPDAANILELKNEAQTSYLEDDLEVFSWLSRYFWFRFERIFLKILRLKKKRVLITSYVQDKF